MYRFVSPLIVLVLQLGFKYNSLRAILLTLFLAVEAIVRLRVGKTMVSILHFAMMVNKIDRPSTTPFLAFVHLPFILF